MALSMTKTHPTGATTIATSTTMRVLLATDGSDAARVATGWLTTVLQPRASEITILAVAQIPWAVPPEAPLPIYDATLSDAARLAAGDARAVLAPRWPRVDVQVVHGDPRALVPEYARAWRADLVVVGARGLGAVAGFFLGSVSTAVVRDAPCPVLVVKGEPRVLERAVIAIDGSEDSLAAARFFGALPLERRAAVGLIGAVERPYVPRTTPLVVVDAVERAVEAIIAERRAHIEAGLRAAEAELGATVGPIDRATSIGAPAEVILEAAKKADLVVVGARGLGAVKRLVLGSVSERVLVHAECPVLVVKRAG